MVGKKETSYKFKLIALIVTLGLCFLSFIFLPESFTFAQRITIATFLFATGFWAFEVIPLYATSILVVLTLTLSLTKPSSLFGSEETSYQFLLLPFSNPVIMLFFGGFVLATAINKYAVDRFFLHKFMKRLTTSPKRLLFGYLFISALFSMWISNTATAAIMVALSKPVIEQLDRNDSFKKAVILAIAFGSNIGGICTPIGTPPNAIAIGVLAENNITVNFFEWMVMAIPLALIILITTGTILIWKYPFKSNKMPKLKSERKILLKGGIPVIIIFFFMVVFWLSSFAHQIPDALVSLLGVGAFATFRLIDANDLKKIQWDILILMWGGLALGLAFQVSKVTDHFFYLSIFKEHSFALVLILCLLAVVISSFISNTATANFIIPLAVSIPAGEKVLLAVTIALSCSFAMAFPVSPPPNAIAYSSGYLKTKDFFQMGSLVSIISLIVILMGFEFVILNLFNLISLK